MRASILLVEDDPTTRLVLSKTLESAGHRVRTADKVKTAIDELTHTTYDIVISDMRLPDSDGLEVLQAAMSLPSPPLVLLLTGYGTLETAIAAIRLGAYDYLLKPCDPPTLLERVANAIERRTMTLRQSVALRDLAQGVAQLQRQLLQIGTHDVAESEAQQPMPPSRSPESPLAVGALQIGRFPHETKYRDQALHLTPIEHALLRCLAEANGRVVGYNEILHHTHGYTATEGEAQNLLKSHVRNIRRKTADNLIISVRHIGYQIGSGHDVAPDDDD